MGISDQHFAVRFVVDSPSRRNHQFGGFGRFNGKSDRIRLLFVRLIIKLYGMIGQSTELHHAIAGCRRSVGGNYDRVFFCAFQRNFINAVFLGCRCDRLEFIRFCCYADGISGGSYFCGICTGGGTKPRPAYTAKTDNTKTNADNRRSNNMEKAIAWRTCDKAGAPTVFFKYRSCLIKAFIHY